MKLNFKKLPEPIYIFLYRCYEIYFLFKFHIHYIYNILKYWNHWPVYYRIFSDKKIIYIENTKVACTSIKTVLRESWEMKSKFSLTGLDLSDYFIFTYVRNPFDRIVSCYNNKITKKSDWWLYIRYPFYSLRYNIRKNMSFKDFVQEIAKIPDVKRDIHFRTQTGIIYKYLPIEESNFINYIWRFENLKEDFDINIAKKIWLSELPQKNISKKKWKSWKDYYDEDTLEIVYEVYKEDFDQWYPNLYKETKKELS